MVDASYGWLRRTRSLLLLIAATSVALGPSIALAQELVPALQADAPPRARALPSLKPERSRSVGRKVVRVPLETGGDEALAPADLTVVAGSAHVARARDGSVELEQAKSSTSVVSVVGPKASSPQRLASTEQKLKLPWLVVDSQAQNMHSVVRSARPFLKLARAVQWDPERKLHVAELCSSISVKRRRRLV